MNLNSISHCVLAVARQLDKTAPKTPSREQSLMQAEDPDQYGPLMEEYFTRTLKKAEEFRGRGMEELAAEEAAIAWAKETVESELR